MADTPTLVPGPLYGLRTWAVVGPPGEERLAGPQRRTPWPDGGAWLKAACERDAAHVAPEHDCVCGIHALHPTAANARRVLALRFEVPGIVECDGPVEVHPDGFRARRGRPYALAALPGRNAARIGRLARAYDAEVVPVGGPDELERWCSEHNLGLAPAAVDEILGPGTVAAWRRTSRRHTRVVAARIVATLLITIGLALAAYAALPGPEGPHYVYGRSGKHLVVDGRPVP